MKFFPEDLDIEEMFEEVAITAEEFLAHKQLEFYQEIASDLPIIESDYTKLKQILDNLMNNAIKFYSHRFCHRSSAGNSGKGSRSFGD